MQTLVYWGMYLHPAIATKSFVIIWGKSLTNGAHTNFNELIVSFIAKTLRGKVTNC